MFADIHYTVGDYCQMMKELNGRINYVTPINFLDTVAGYKM